MKMNSYDLLRNWFNFKFENLEKVNSKHSEFFCYLVDKWNRLGQKETFGLPTEVTMEVLGIGSYNTYKKTFQDLIDFGFVELIKDSKNQHSSRVIALSKNDKATDKALNKAHTIAPDEADDKATDEAVKSYINKQTNKQINKQTSKEGLSSFNFSTALSETYKATNDPYSFDNFWQLYDKKVGKKETLQSKYKKLSAETKKKIFDYLPKYKAAQPDSQYRKNPETFLNKEGWNDEIVGLKAVTQNSKMRIF